MRRLNIAALLLLAVGLTQIIGYITGVRTLRGLGAASATAPFPKVFSALQGYETFAAEFTIVYESGKHTVRQPITPELYENLIGPYNRRNVYGAALSYGPRLPRKLWEPVFCHGLKPGGTFYSEFGLPNDAQRIRVEIRSKTKGQERTWILDPNYSK